MKNNFLILLFLLFYFLGNTQSITPKNIAKIPDDINNQTRNAFLEKMGFQNWTATENGQNWYNQKTKESVELTYDEVYHNEGGENTVAIYYLKNGLHKNFVNQLAAAKFIYSKRNKHYVRRFNTYTYETIKIEMIDKDANITYIKHLGKENGGYPGLQIPKPPIQDTIIKKEKNRNDTIVRKFVGTKQVEKSRFFNEKLVAKKNFVTGDFKRFNSNSQMIYHSYPQKKGKEYIIQEWDSDGKEKYKSFYSEETKEILIYHYGILFQKAKILKTDKLWVTEYDQQGNIVSEKENFRTLGVAEYDESEY